MSRYVLIGHQSHEKFSQKKHPRPTGEGTFRSKPRAHSGTFEHIRAHSAPGKNFGVSPALGIPMMSPLPAGTFSASDSALYNIKGEKDTWLGGGSRSGAAAGYRADL